MIQTETHAKAVQAARTADGKHGVAKAVRRFYARQDEQAYLPHNVRRGQGGPKDRPKLGPIEQKREDMSAWKALPYSMGGRRG